MSDAELLRDQEELNGSAADTQAEFVRAALVNLHTSMPGIIKSYNATKQTAEVQPAIKRIVVVDGEVQKMRLPVCLDVPVCMFGNALTAPIVAGDDCLLLFAERCFDRWYASGGVQDPADFRMHDLSDGFAIVGFNSQPAKLTSVPSSARATEPTALLLVQEAWSSSGQVRAHPRPAWPSFPSSPAGS
jgi:hypothetical protein